MTPFTPDTRPLTDYFFWTGFVSDVPAPGGGSIQFNQTMSHDRVGGGWATWSHGYSGDVYANWWASSPTRDRLVMTLPANTQAFYFYTEPNLQSTYNVTATTDDGTTSGPVEVNGFAGARYFGFYTMDGSSLSTVAVDVDSAAQGFAVGEFGIATDPLPLSVTAVKPAAGATGVSRRANVVATFSEEVNTETLSTETFQLYKLTAAGPTRVANVTVKPSLDGTKATLNPYGTSDRLLAKNAKYKAVVTTGVEDPVGNTMAADKAWTFRTGAR